MWILTMSFMMAAGTGGHHVMVAPAESLWVESRGAGHGVVLIPGLFGSSFGYRHVTGMLGTDGYHTAVIEPLGVGRSARPLGADYSLTAQAGRIAAVMDSLGIVDALVIAHSIGVAMALRLAYVRPDLVRGIVALDGGAAESALTAGMSGAFVLGHLLKLPGARGLLRRQIAAKLRAASGDAGWVTDDVIDAYGAGPWTDPGRAVAVFRAMANAREPEPLAPLLGAIRAPVLLLLGGAPKDGGLTEAEARHLATRLPQLTLEVIPTVGHYIHEERPDLVAAALARLCRETVGRNSESNEDGRSPCVRS